MIPPVSFLFLETSSKDLSMALVEVVSLLSVALLAIFKVSAINYKDYFQYVINLAYYLASAVSRSICSCLAGYTAWLHNLLRELHSPLSTATLVYCDNVSAVYMFANPVQHQRTKHIEIDIHFVHDMVTAGQVRVLHVPSRYQYADIFTKGLPSALFEEFRSSKCRADYPFVDVLPADDPPIREDSIVKANKIFDSFKMGYIKESLIQTKGVAAKKALVDRFGPLEEEDQVVV
ncbi:ribonuclease H-like domain-containing protein [Tanacetum coccineum]